MPSAAPSFKYWIELPDDQQFIPVSKMRSLVWRAAEQGGIDRKAAFEFGLNIDEQYVERVVREWRDAKKLRVFISRGLGELTGHVVKFGVLRRVDFALLVGEVFNCGVRGHKQQAEPSGDAVRRWTSDRLADLKQYRDQHGTKAAAEHFRVSTSRVRALLPGERRSKGYGPFTQAPAATTGWPSTTPSQEGARRKVLR